VTPSIRALVNALAVIAATAACPFVLSGCSADDLQGGKVVYSSYPPVSMLPSPPPGSPVLPSAFPRDVPVVKGLYAKRTGPGGTQILTVTGVTSDALADARKLFAAAGFQPQTFVGQEAFLGSAHLVLLSSEDLPGSFSITYTVTPMTMPGIGSIPTTIPKLF